MISDLPLLHAKRETAALKQGGVAQTPFQPVVISLQLELSPYSQPNRLVLNLTNLLPCACTLHKCLLTVKAF